MEGQTLSKNVILIKSYALLIYTCLCISPAGYDAFCSHRDPVSRLWKTDRLHFVTPLQRGREFQHGDVVDIGDVSVVLV